MKKEFVPYEQALLLKELGFEEECFGKYYYVREHEVYDPRKGEDFMFGDNNRIILRETPCNYGYDANEITVCVAPLYQQAFRWFRDKYKLQCYPMLDTEDIYWCLFSDGAGSGYLMIDGDYGYFAEEHLEFKTYEEAELACLKKLIEIAQKSL